MSKQCDCKESEVRKYKIFDFFKTSPNESKRRGMYQNADFKVPKSSKYLKQGGPEAQLVLLMPNRLVMQSAWLELVGQGWDLRCQKTGFPRFFEPCAAAYLLSHLTGRL